MNRKKNIIKNTTKYANFVISVFIIILLNAIGIGLFKNLRLDLTKSGSFSLSKTSKNVVANLADPLNIYVFFSKKLPSNYSHIEQYLDDLLSEYKLAGNKYFHYKFFDCTEENGSDKIKKNIEKANAFGIYPTQIQKLEKSEVAITNKYMGIVIQNGDMIERITDLKSTAGLEYRITNMIEKMNNKVSYLLALKDRISIKLYLSPVLLKIAAIQGIEGLDNIQDKIEGTIEELNKKYYEKLNFMVSDIAKDPAAEKEIEKYDLQKLSWNSFKDHSSGKTFLEGEGTAAIVFEFDNESRILELLDIYSIQNPFTGEVQTQCQLISTDNLEERLSSVIDSLININKKIAYLSDHGTFSVSSNQYSQEGGGQGAEFSKLISSNYSINQVTIDSIDNSIPSLIIAGAEEEFTDWDLYKIDQYIMNGGSLIVFQSGLKMKNLSRQPHNRNVITLPNKNNLDKLLSHYGISIKNNYLYDKNCYRDANTGRDHYEYPTIYGNTINKKIKTLKNISKFLMVQTSPISIDDEKIKSMDLKATALFSSSNAAWLSKENANMNQPPALPPEDEELKQYPLAYLLEGKFTSYFADKKIPDRPVRKEDENKEETKEKGESSFVLDQNISNTPEMLKKGKGSRIIVVGASYVIANEIMDIRLSQEFQNRLVVFNLIDLLNAREDWGVMRSKTEQRAPFKPIDEKAGFFEKFITAEGYKALEIFNWFFVPGFVAIAGVIVFLMRKRRREKIQSMFNGK